MPRTYQIQILPEDTRDEQSQRKAISKATGIPEKELGSIRIERRSIDARSRQVKINLKLTVYSPNEPVQEEDFRFKTKQVGDAEPVHIIGAGPAGLFAALRLIELGKKPVLFERGKPVRERRRDLALLTKEHIVNPESNYCFGEGGAGTYSDGKLYTRSTKRGDVKSVLAALVAHGASPDILIDAHPHIGTNKLPGIIEAIRETILNCGGEVRFNSKLTDIDFDSTGIRGITINDSEKIVVRHLILATGHSARDIFYLLHRKNILIEEKTFALGVRAEHPQEIIDKAQYHCDSRSPYLPPASYALVDQIRDIGVYSFCMCPGGIIAPCATAPEEIVTNGWSPSRRNNPFANSGIVTTVTEEELTGFRKFGPLAALKFQETVERQCWIAGGKTQTAPAQRLMDFIEGKTSSTLPDCSYYPGIKSVSLKDVLPESLSERLKGGFKSFARKMKGYGTNESVLVAPESRTSSPVRIPRDKLTLEHPQVKGLFPCGEGGGYAGGIVSAAIDGQRCAEAAIGFRSLSE